jgi:hypothetical protein
MQGRKSMKIKTLLFAIVSFVYLAQATYAADTLRFIATHTSPTINSNSLTSSYLLEIDGTYSPYDRLSAVHMDLVQFKSLRNSQTITKAILNIWNVIFTSNGSIVPNLDTRLNELGKEYIDGYRNKILAFYVFDEPTNNGITKKQLELVISQLNARFPNIPSYITYSQNCFDPDPALTNKCSNMDPINRGIPSNLDWVGFDWYLTNNPFQDEEFFYSQIKSTLNRLKALTNKPIVLTPDAMDAGLGHFSPAWRDEYLTQRFHRYLMLANSDSQVIGLDSYTWGEYQENMSTTYGTRWYPALKRALFNAAGPIINRSVVGNNVYVPDIGFDGQFIVWANGEQKFYYKNRTNMYFCAYRNRTEYLQHKSLLGITGETPVFTHLEGLFDNKMCL